MSISIIPPYLTPLSRWTEPVQVTAAPVVKKTTGGEVKTSPAFPGLTPYRLGVEIITGMKTKTMPSGEKLSFPQVETKNVTVWADGALYAAPGEYITLVEPMLGAVDGSIYVQALGIEPVESSDGLDGLLSGGDVDE